jgi:hypothetical protein
MTEKTKVAGENEPKPMLSEYFTQALMHDLVKSHEAGQEVNGKFLKAEIVMEVQSDGKMLKVVHQDISEVVKNEPKADDNE